MIVMLAAILFYFLSAAGTLTSVLYSVPSCFLFSLFLFFPFFLFLFLSFSLFFFLSFSFFRKSPLGIGYIYVSDLYIYLYYTVFLFTPHTLRGLDAFVT